MVFKTEVSAPYTQIFQKLQKICFSKERRDIWGVRDHDQPLSNVIVRFETRYTLENDIKNS